MPIVRKRRRKARVQGPPAKPAVPLPVRLPVDLQAETILDVDGWPIREGHVVRRVRYVSPSLGVEVASAVGVVLGAYRRVEGGPVLLDIRLDRDTCAAGRATFSVERVKRSSATVRGVTAADWHGARAKGRGR